jgi:hypothetical protein
LSTKKESSPKKTKGIINLLSPEEKLIYYKYGRTPFSFSDDWNPLLEIEG